MAHAYTPGLRVSHCVKHRTRRMLPISGEVVVSVGDRVNAQDVVARTFLPGPVIPFNLSNKLGVAATDVPRCLLKIQGDTIRKDELIARSPGIFGMFQKEAYSPDDGTVETISQITGQVILRGAPEPIEVLAYLAGEVVEVLPEQGVDIEADIAMAQGILGIGGEAFGTIRLACQSPEIPLTPDLIHEDMRGQIVVGGARMTGEAIKRAIKVGTAAVISGGMDDQDLKDILGQDLGVAITGSERIGTSLVITEGFGDIAMAARTFELFQLLEGREAAANGATQIRAGVLRPEILIPLNPDEVTPNEEPSSEHGLLVPGARVRMIRDPYFGLLGKVDSLPHELTVLDSGSKARVLTVILDDSRHLTVPRANVELIEE
ncbi:MAG: hypothetical protein P8M30_16755 [Planctomycetaceae bacterium]|nr:hypothetical protein [Planctomycetaceae bacterium]